MDEFAVGLAVFMGLVCTFFYDRYRHNGESTGNEMFVNVLVFCLSTLLMIGLYFFTVRPNNEATKPAELNKSINQKIIDSQLKPMSDGIKNGSL